MANHSYMTFTLTDLTDRATVGIQGQTFTIEYNGVGVSSGGGSDGVTLGGLSISSTTLVITPVSGKKIDKIVVRIYVATKDGSDLPPFVGGPLSIPSGSTFHISVDNGGESDFTADNNDWSTKVDS